MKPSALTASLVWLWLTSVPVVASAATRNAAPEIVSTDVCSVLDSPETFVNRVIRLRGFVYLGVDHMNVSDRACPGRGIELAIKSDPIFKQKDVYHFYMQLNHQGRMGIATITGLLQSDPSPLTPYILSIQHVTDVAAP